MSLVDDAIKEYAKELSAEKENAEKEREKYIEDGIKIIKRLFGENLKVETVEEVDTFGERCIAFLVDGLKMRARMNRGYYDIFLVQRCKKCDSEFEDHIINLKNIGKAIKDGHWPQDCKNALEAKEPKKIMGTEDRLLEALRDFVAENSNIG